MIYQGELIVVKIIQGEKQTVTIELTSQKSGNKFDLTGATEIVVCFVAGTTVIQKLLSLSEVTVVSALNGEITADLLVADTDTLPATTDGKVEVQVTFGAGDVRKAQILNAFTVAAKFC